MKTVERMQLQAVIMMIASAKVGCAANSRHHDGRTRCSRSGCVRVRSVQVCRAVASLRRGIQRRAVLQPAAHDVPLGARWL